MSEPSNHRFWSLHVNGRARFALATALLVPPVGVAWNLAWTDTELEWLLVALLWAFFACASLLFAYLILGIGRFLAWVRDGMTGPEWRAAKVATWMLLFVGVVSAGGVVAITKFQNLTRPEKNYQSDSWQKFRLAPSWYASTDEAVAIPGPDSASKI